MKNSFIIFIVLLITTTCIASEVNIVTGGLQPYKAISLTKNSNKNYFSISAKLPLLINNNAAPELNYNVFLAYSQKSIWIPSASSGNDENYLYSNYNPEIFYLYDFHNRFNIPLLLQVGFEHESDGLGKLFDKQHREWDRFSLTPHAAFFNDQLKVSFKIWYASLDLKYNSDIARYMGFSELKLTTNYLKNYYQPKIELTVRKGSTRKLSDFTFILDHHLDLFNMVKHNYQIPIDFYTQAFYGYGEYLKSYKRINKSLNFGISCNI